MLHLRRGAAALTAGLLGLALTTTPVDAADGESPDDSDYRMQLVLDSSGSMKERVKGGTKIKAAKKALDTVIDNLPGEAQVGMRVYGATVSNGKGACTDSQQVVEPGTENRDALHKAIDDYKPLGETPIGYALQKAAEDLGSDGKRTIVLVSDGESTCNPDPCKVARKLSKDGIDLRIDVVGLSVDPKTRKQLTCIAEAGNGTYYDADDAESLTRGIDTLSTRAFRPFGLTGTPVTGGDQPVEAPTLGSGGQYLDKLPVRGAKQFYRIERTVPSSTVHVGTTARTPVGSMGSGVAMQLRAENTDTLCGDGGSTGNAQSARRPLLAASISSADPYAFGTKPCAKADYYTLAVELLGGGELARTPFELAVYEEPPLVDGADKKLPPAAEEPTWTAMEPGDPSSGVTPGTSLVNAPVLDDGTYALDIQTGETQVFAVPVAWGRRLQVQIDSDLSDPAYDNAGSLVGFGAKIYGPVRGAESKDTGLGTTPDAWTKTPFGSLQFEGKKHWRTGAMTPMVRYLNRESSPEEVRSAALPGYRYVEVNLSVSQDGVTIPYQLTVKRFGEAGKGAPEYEVSAGLTVPAADSTYTSLGDTPDDGGSGSTDSTDSTDPEDNASDSEDATSGDEGAASDEDADLASNSESGSDDFPMLVLLLGGAGIIILAGGITAVALARRPR